MEWLVYIANLLYLASYFTQNILRLRALTITAALCLVGYFYLRPEPLLTVVFWNLVFVGLNIAQMARILIARRRRGGTPAAGAASDAGAYGPRADVLFVQAGNGITWSHRGRRARRRAPLPASRTAEGARHGRADAKSEREA